MSPREYNRILKSLSPIEREMLRDIDNGTVYGRTEHNGGKPGLSPLLDEDAARIRRLKKLARQFKDAADAVVIHTSTFRCSHPGHELAAAKKHSAKRAKRVKVAA